MFVPRVLPAICLTSLLGAGSAVADAQATAVAKAFSNNCFNPRLTAETAQQTLAVSGARVDFYDLSPFSGAAPSKPEGRAPTPRTDRRCEVASDGYHFKIAQRWVESGLEREGLSRSVTGVPPHFPVQPGTTFIVATRLNPSRIAVVQIGLRDGPNGDETFINLERMVPSDEVGK